MSNFPASFLHFLPFEHCYIFKTATTAYRFLPFAIPHYSDLYLLSVAILAISQLNIFGFDAPTL